MTALFRISDGKLMPVQRRRLASGELLENWIVADPGLIGLDVFVIGRQVVTEFNGKIDIAFFRGRG